MKAYIDVLDENERDMIAQGLCDPEVRALVKIMGVLLPLKESEQAFVLNKVVNELDIPL